VARRAAPRIIVAHAATYPSQVRQRAPDIGWTREREHHTVSRAVVGHRHFDDLEAEVAGANE
jgi:hypothetical protein